MRSAAVVFDQGAALVGKALATGTLYQERCGGSWYQRQQNNSSLHFIGLFGRQRAFQHYAPGGDAGTGQDEGEKARIHPLIDGRDVPPTSALEYVDRFENFLKEINSDGSVDYCVASGGGRMNITMDRYNANWSMVERGWATHVKGEGRRFASMRQAIETYRKDAPGILDQTYPLCHRARRGSGRTGNRRRQRHLFQLPRRPALGSPGVRGGAERVPEGPGRYFSRDDAVRRRSRCPKRYLVTPAIDCTMSQYLSAGVKQFAISETQKFGHMTYFFNGNNSGQFASETWKDSKSDICPFEQAPRA